MPPVFGPVSPSPTRLWSWAGSRIQHELPSVRAKIETSGPESISSISSVSPESPNSRSTMTRAMASSASANVLQIMTPLPAANPAALITQGSSLARTYSKASSGIVNMRASAVGTFADRINCLAKALSASSRAPSADGPKTNLVSVAKAS